MTQGLARYSNRPRRMRRCVVPVEWGLSGGAAGMIPGRCRLLAGLALLCLPVTAVAQIIPQIAPPGRERERFVEPPAPRAQPSGEGISLPSTVAPAGAAS